jgi:hypothetical protein
MSISKNTMVVGLVGLALLVGTNIAWASSTDNPPIFECKNSAESALRKGIYEAVANAAINSTFANSKAEAKTRFVRECVTCSQADLTLANDAIDQYYDDNIPGVIVSIYDRPDCNQQFLVNLIQTYNAQYFVDYAENVVAESNKTQVGSAVGADASGHRAAPAPAKALICADNTPAGIVDLFQIDRKDKTATLYFTPVSDHVNRYHVVFGHKDGEELYGQIFAEITGESNDGVQVVTINELDPALQYSFQVMPVNGCAVGARSNWLTSVSAGISYRYN